MKTNFLQILLIVLLISNVSLAQSGSLVKSIEYNNILGYSLTSRGTSMIKNNQNEIIVAGDFSDNQAMFLAHWSPLGYMLQLSRIIYTQFGVKAKSLSQNGNGQYIAAIDLMANASGPLHRAMFLVIDTSSTVQNKIIGDTLSYGTSVMEISPGNYIYTGLFSVNGILRPSLLKLNNAGDVVSAVYLQLNVFATDKFRFRDIGNGKLVLEGLHNVTAIMDTNFTLINQSIFGFGAVTSIVNRNLDNNFIWIAHDTIGVGSSVSVAVTDTTFGNIISNIRFNAPGVELTPLKLFQDLTGNYSLFIRTKESPGTNGLLVVSMTDSLTISGMNLYKPAAITGSIYGYFPEDILSDDFGRSYSTGDVYLNLSTGTNDMAFAIIDSNSNCWANPFSINSLPTFTDISPIVQVIPFTISSSSYPLSTGAVSHALVTHCNTLSQPESSDPESILTIFPTVSSSEINIKFGDNLKKGEIYITDITGRLIYQNNDFYSGQLNVEQFSAGSYFVIVTTSEGRYARQFYKM